MTTKTKKTLIDINGFAAKIALSFAAKNDIRYYLNGINIKPLDAGGAMISATDGHKLIVIRDLNGTAAEDTIVKVTADTARNLKQDTRMQCYPG